MTFLVKGDDEEPGTDEPVPNPARSLCTNSGHSSSDQLAVPQALTRGPTRFLHPRQLRGFDIKKALVFCTKAE